MINTGQSIEEFTSSPIFTSSFNE